MQLIEKFWKQLLLGGAFLCLGSAFFHASGLMIASLVSGYLLVLVNFVIIIEFAKMFLADSKVGSRASGSRKNIILLVFSSKFLILIAVLSFFILFLKFDLFLTWLGALFGLVVCCVLLSVKYRENPMYLNT